MRISADSIRHKKKLRTSPNITDFWQSNSPQKNYGFLQTLRIFVNSIRHINNIFIIKMETPHLNYIIQTYPSAKTTPCR